MTDLIREIINNQKSVGKLEAEIKQNQFNLIDKVRDRNNRVRAIIQGSIAYRKNEDGNLCITTSYNQANTIFDADKQRNAIVNSLMERYIGQSLSQLDSE